MRTGDEIQSKLNYDLKRAATFMPLGMTSGVSPKTGGNGPGSWFRLGTTPVQAGLKEAYILLDSASHRLSGSGGCNQLVGSYEIKGNQLKFGQIAGTRMACAKGWKQRRPCCRRWARDLEDRNGQLELFDCRR